MMVPTRLKLISKLLIFIFVLSTLSQADSLHSLVDGRPENQATLGGSAYMFMRARHPALARFVFLNFSSS
jgi:hypothetical protein